MITASATLVVVFFAVVFEDVFEVVAFGIVAVCAIHFCYAVAVDDYWAEISHRHCLPNSGNAHNTHRGHAGKCLLFCAVCSRSI